MRLHRSGIAVFPNGYCGSIGREATRVSLADRVSLLFRNSPTYRKERMCPLFYGNQKTPFGRPNSDRRRILFRRLSAHVGDAHLRKSNTFLRSRLGRALAAVREDAVHRPLDTRTQDTCVRAPVKIRPQNSHVVKLESSPQLTELSDLRCADRGR